MLSSTTFWNDALKGALGFFSIFFKQVITCNAPYSVVSDWKHILESAAIQVQPRLIQANPQIAFPLSGDISLWKYSPDKIHLMLRCKDDSNYTNEGVWQISVKGGPSISRVIRVLLSCGCTIEKSIAHRVCLSMFSCELGPKLADIIRKHKLMAYSDVPKRCVDNFVEQLASEDIDFYVAKPKSGQRIICGCIGITNYKGPYLALVNFNIDYDSWMCSSFYHEILYSCERAGFRQIPIILE